MKMKRTAGRVTTAPTPTSGDATKTPAPRPRRCFTYGCDGVPVGNNWECPRCKRRIHQASERPQQAKQQQAKTRCRMGACSHPDLPELHGCDACRRVGVERRKAALASEVTT